MSRPPSDGSPTENVRRTVEEYTPNGTTGRIALATVTGLATAFTAWLGLVGLLIGGAVSLVLTPAAAIASGPSRLRLSN